MDELNTFDKIFIGVICVVFVVASLWVFGFFDADNSNVEYKSNIPAQYERTTENDFADTNFVTVMKCDSSVSYKVPYKMVQQNKQNNKILLIENYTNKEYVFNGNEFMVISEQYDWVLNRTERKIFGNCNTK